MTEQTEPWSATITRADNGYIITTTPDPITLVVEDSEADDEFKSEAETLAKVFQEVQESFGVFNSKHNKYRLVIEVIEQ